ncbi:MAG: D-glutamate cyclase family protein [Mastigocoleus sp.]
MRPLPTNKIVRAIEVTSRYHKAHGSSIQIANPESIGIKDLEKPDYGDSITINNGEFPVFWAYGVTTQTAIWNAKPELAITHSPGHMFVSNIKDEELIF